MCDTAVAEAIKEAVKVYVTCRLQFSARQVVLSARKEHPNINITNREGTVEVYRLFQQGEMGHYMAQLIQVDETGKTFIVFRHTTLKSDGAFISASNAFAGSEMAREWEKWANSSDLDTVAVSVNIAGGPRVCFMVIRVTDHFKKMQREMRKLWIG
jgi:hypothetical protein